MMQFNSKYWNNIDLIFPEGGTYLDGIWYDNNEIRFLNDLPLIQSSVIKPIRNSIASESKIIWYNNGDMDRRTVYNAFPPVLIDNISPLNIYGQKIYNQMKKENL